MATPSDTSEDTGSRTGPTPVVRRARRSGGTDRDGSTGAVGPSAATPPRRRRRRSDADGPTTGAPAATGSTGDDRDGRRGTDAVITVVDLAGPRVRMGILWFLVALAAVTSGRWWTAWLIAATSAAAGYQLVRVWSTDADDAPRTSHGVPAAFYAAGLWALIAGFTAGLAPLAAGYGTGLAGVVLLVAATVAMAARTLGGPVAGTAVAAGAVLPAVAGTAVVIAVRADLWAGLFLVVAVSLYDAGAYLLGAESTRRWEGPIAGIVGVLAVTFTISAIGVDPFDRLGWWIVGILVAPACIAGQWVTTQCLPRPDSRARAMRRLDGYVVAGPVLVVGIWFLGS